MSIKNKLFWGALLLISVSWVVNAFYAQSKKLDAPIFLAHAIDIELGRTNDLTLYYVTNVNDPSLISRISFNDVHGYVEDSQWDQAIQSSSHYALRQALITLDTWDLQLEEKRTTETIDVFFNDGDRMTVPIGQITIQPEKPIGDVLDGLGASGSSDGESIHWYQAKEAIKIEEISMAVPEDLQQYLTVRIDTPTLDQAPNPEEQEEQNKGVPLDELKFPIELQKDELLYIYWEVSPRFFGSIHSSLMLSGRTSSGNRFIESSPLYNQQPYFEKDMIRRFIDMKEVSK